MISLVALHQIAAPRRDGLHPELVKFLMRSSAIANGPTGSEDLAATQSPADLTQGNRHTSLQCVLRIQTERK
jgi:hypothetical protein